jgi:hypothetical protein
MLYKRELKALSRPQSLHKPRHKLEKEIECLLEFMLLDSQS